MHILYLHQYFVPPDGSGGTRSYEMARRMVDAGHKVTIITSNAALPDHYVLSGRRTDKCIDGINLVILRVAYANRMSYLRRILAFLKFALGTFKEVTSIKEVNLVFATSTPLTVAIPAIYAKVLHRCPMVFEVRDLWPELPIAIGALKNKVAIWLAERLERLAYFQSERVVALSPGMADGVANTGFPENRISVIPNSCDTALFKVPPEQGQSFLDKNPHLADGPLVVYTGTMGRINGVSYLVKLASEMKSLQPEVRFLISGWGREKLELKSLAAELNVLEENLWLVDTLPKAEMPQLLSAASLATSLFVDMPEMWNNSANKFFDALAAGRPVAINYNGWQADFIRDSGAGIVLPPSDPAAGAGIMRDFLYDEERVTSAREAAATAAEHRFNRDLLAQKLIKDLENATRGQSL